MLKDILSSIYGIYLPEISEFPNTGQFPQGNIALAKLKTYADLSPDGKTCDWSKRIVPIYEAKEWEKNPIAGTIHDDA